MEDQSVSFLNPLQYMTVLLVVFVLQFSLSCACLALNKDQQVGLLFSPLPDWAFQLKISAFAPLDSPAGGRVEQIGGHSEGRGEKPELLRLLQLQPQQLLRCCENPWPCFSTNQHPRDLSSSVFQACSSSSPPSCPTCSSIMQEHAGEVLRFVGGIGLFFSFTEVGREAAAL